MVLIFYQLHLIIIYCFIIFHLKRTLRKVTIKSRENEHDLEAIKSFHIFFIGSNKLILFKAYLSVMDLMVYVIRLIFYEIRYLYRYM